MDYDMIMKNEYNKELTLLLYSYIAWTVAINLNIVNIYIFSKLSNRKFRLDRWAYMDVTLMILAFLLLLDTDLVTDLYNSTGLNTIPIDINSNLSFILKTVLIAVNDIFVWFRLSGILLTFKEYGPSLRMIYLLCITISKYLIILVLYLYCCVAIFTSFFYNASPKEFGSYSQSLVTLFKAFITDFETSNFTSHKLLGACMILIFVTLSGVLLMNLLIALLNQIYKKFEKFIDASHNSVLISYFRRYKWDSIYGFLLFLPTPLNLVNFFLLPFSFLLKKTTKIFTEEDTNEKNKKSKQIRYNMLVCKIYFIIFYIPIILAIQTVGELVALPLCYIKGLVFMIRHQFDIKQNFVNKVRMVLRWVFFGLIYLCGKSINDKILVLKRVFSPLNVSNIDNNRYNVLDKNEIKIFLDFVHTRGNDVSNDLQTIFKDYTKYDIMKKREGDDTLKEKVNYLDKLFVKNINKSKNSPYHSTFLLFHGKPKGRKAEIVSNTVNYNKMCRRNLLIIEIFENFLINDGSDNQIVDLEKLNNLLPRTTNINSAYIKRLMYTNLKSVGTAIDKLNTNSAKNHLREKMLSKVEFSAEFFDNYLDNSISSSRLLNIFKFKEVNDKEIELLNDLKMILNRINESLKEFR